MAESVRKLAEESASSAKEITSLVADVRQQTVQLSQVVETAVQEVRYGADRLEQAGKTISGIADNAHQSARHMEQAGHQVDRVVEAVNRILRNIHDIRTFAQKTADGTPTVSAATKEQLAIAERVSASAVSLSNTASTLQNVTDRFKV